MKCAVANCASDNNRKACDISFFVFPSDVALAKEWTQFCRRGKAFNPKTSFVCMKHFTGEDIFNKRQFEMGFAKKRLLKRGVVPTIYIEDVEKSQRAESVQLMENKKNGCELLQQIEFVAVNESQANYTGDSIPIDESVENMENSLMEVNHSQFSASSTPSNEFYSYSSLQEVEELEAKLETVKRENMSLVKENKKKDAALAALQQEYEKQKGKHVREVEQLQKCLSKSKNMCRNMESKLQSIFTKGQVAKLKYGIEKPVYLGPGRHRAFHHIVCRKSQMH